MSATTRRLCCRRRLPSGSRGSSTSSRPGSPPPPSTPAARDYALFRTLYHAGLRSEEASPLDRPDVHFGRGPFGKPHVRSAASTLPAGTRLIAPSTTPRRCGPSPGRPRTGGGDRSDQRRDRERPLRVRQRHVVRVGDGMGNVTFTRSADGSRCYAVDRSPEKLNAGDETVLDGIYVSGSGNPLGPWTRIADADTLAASGSALDPQGSQAPPARPSGRQRIRAGATPPLRWGLVRKCPSHRICSTVDVITGRRLRWRLPSPRWAARRRSVVRPGRRRRRRDVPHWRLPRRTARTRKGPPVSS